MRRGCVPRTHKCDKIDFMISAATYSDEMIKRHLALAERHVAEAGLNIRRQRAVIRRLQQIGGDSTNAAELLDTFLSTYSLCVRSRDRLRSMVAE